MSEFKMGSLFDGSGGFPLAAKMCGIEPVWASEIEKFPIEVTTKRFPNMKHLGDITKLNGADLEPVDLITFGSPCQDLSVAGLRSGLSGERSGLFNEAIRIIKEMRDATNGRYPTVALWENVPGALSSGKNPDGTRCPGEDFRIVLESFCKVEDSNAYVPRPKNGKWTDAGAIRFNGGSLAYRVLDSQYWGVPQRRRRIFLTCAYADRGESSLRNTDDRAEKILFVRPRLSRDFKSCCETWQGPSGSIEDCVRAWSR